MTLLQDMFGSPPLESDGSWTEKNGSDRRRDAGSKDPIMAGDWRMKPWANKVKRKKKKEIHSIPMWPDCVATASIFSLFLMLLTISFVTYLTWVCNILNRKDPTWHMQLHVHAYWLRNTPLRGDGIIYLTNLLLGFSFGYQTFNTHPGSYHGVLVCLLLNS